MLHRCNVREWKCEGMGKALWESHGNGNWLQNWEWEWEGMGIDCTGMGGSGNVKNHFRASLLCTDLDVVVHGEVVDLLRVSASLSRKRRQHFRYHTYTAQQSHIQFKIATVMHATLNQRGPAYLNNIIKFNGEESGRRHLRSSTTNAAVVARTRTQFTGSAPSPSEVQVSGTRFLLTSGTFIMSRLFAKL